MTRRLQIQILQTIQIVYEFIKDSSKDIEYHQGLEDVSRPGIRHTDQTQRPWMTSLFLTQHKSFQRPPSLFGKQYNQHVPKQA